MCDGGITEAALPIGSALAATGGAAYSTVAANKAAGVEAKSQAQMVENQNNAFYARNSAAQNLAQATGQIQEQGIAQQQAAADAMRTRQDQALSGQEQQIQQVNQQASQNDQTGQSLGQTLTGATSAPALASAQAADAAARTAAVAPTVQNIAVSNPLAASSDSAQGGTPQSTGESAVQQATLKRMAEAASSVRDYASRAATIGSYTAPAFTVGPGGPGEPDGLCCSLRNFRTSFSSRAKPRSCCRSRPNSATRPTWAPLHSRTFRAPHRVSSRARTSPTATWWTRRACPRPTRTSSPRTRPIPPQPTPKSSRAWGRS